MPMQPEMMRQGAGDGAPMQPPADSAGPMHMMGEPDAMMSGMHQAMFRLLGILIDVDGDGSLSMSEWAAVQERIFRAVDGDDDDRVTLEEAMAFWHGDRGPMDR
jgi:hypothetical protein